MSNVRPIRVASGAALALACVLLAGTGTTACAVYDESLLEHAEETDGHDDSHGGHGSEGEELALADECDASHDDIPVLESAEEHRIVTTVLLEDDERLFPVCSYDYALDGPDAFFKVDVLSGERWHMAVTPDNAAVDIAAVILGSCDPQTCRSVNDQCGAGAAEELTLVAEADETWFVGLDSHTADLGTEIELIVQRTTCGDGTAEHGEPCDDGNRVPGDGCDSNCRIELASGVVAEEEPNNQHMEANVLRTIGSGEVSVAGKLGGPCDTDHFIFQVPQGGSVLASFLDGGGQPCAEGSADVNLKLVRPSTGTVLGTGIPGRGGGACPTLEEGDAFNENLDAGEYHLVLFAPDAPPSFDYTLRLTADAQGT